MISENISNPLLGRKDS